MLVLATLGKEGSTLDDSCQLVVFVKIDELSVGIARRDAMAGITLTAEGNISQIQPYLNALLTARSAVELGTNPRKGQLVDWCFVGETGIQSSCGHGPPFCAELLVAPWSFGISPDHIQTA